MKRISLLYLWLNNPPAKLKHILHLCINSPLYSLYLPKNDRLFTSYLTQKLKFITSSTIISTLIANRALLIHALTYLQETLTRTHTHTPFMLFVHHRHGNWILFVLIFFFVSWFHAPEEICLRGVSASSLSYALFSVVPFGTFWGRWLSEK